MQEQEEPLHQNSRERESGQDDIPFKIPFEEIQPHLATLPEEHEGAACQREAEVKVKVGGGTVGVLTHEFGLVLG